MLATAEEQHVGPMLWHPAFGGGEIGDNRKRALGGASSVINLILADLKVTSYERCRTVIFVYVCIYLFFKGKKTSKYHRAHSLLFSSEGGWSGGGRGG